jgi:hypothetical protein
MVPGWSLLVAENGAAAAGSLGCKRERERGGGEIKRGERKCCTVV